MNESAFDDLLGAIVTALTTVSDPEPCSCPPAAQRIAEPTVTTMAGHNGHRHGLKRRQLAHHIRSHPK